jgi:flagellar biosynthesis chaperone FliJ
LQDISGKQLSNAERQVIAAESQVSRLERRIQQAKDQFDADLAQNRAYYDAILQRAQSQIDALRGVDISVVGVQTAVSMLQTAVQAEAVAQTQIAQLEAQLNTAQQQLNALRGIDASVKSVGTALRGFTSAISNELAAARALETPAFAAGGMHMGGLRMVGENGPELEVTGPARYFSAGQTASMMGGGAEVAQELRGLREENKAQARALVGLQSRMTRLLERWDGDGIPEERTVSA